MKLNRFFILTIIVALVTFSCGTDNDLTPNPTFDPEASDQSSNNNDDDDGGNDDDGNDDGGDDDDGGDNDTTSTDPYFRADIDGVTSGFPSRAFQTVGSTVEIKGEKSASIEGFTFYLDATITEGDTIFLGRTTNYAEYFGSNFITYVTENGYIVFNRVNSLFVEADFEFDASAVADTSLRVDVTNGEFLVNR